MRIGRREVASEGIVVSVRTGHVFRLAHRYDVDADTFGHIQRPVVTGHAGHDVLAMQAPLLPYATVLDPDVGIVGRETIAQVGILYEHGRMRLHLVVHDFALVDDQVLYTEGGRKQFAAGSIVIELAPRQRQDGHAQLVQLLVDNAGMFAQREAKVGIHVVIGQLSVRVRTLDEQFDGPVAQKPDADVHQEKVGFHQAAQFFDRGFLQHEVELVGISSRGNKNTVVLGQVGVYPQAIAHHIGLGNRLQGLGGTDIDIAAGNQGMQGLGSFLQNLLIERQLEGQEVLRQALSAGPPKYRYRGEHLARRRIARQTTALATGMQQDALLAPQPFGEGSLGRPLVATGLQEPGRTPTGAQLTAHWVGRTEPFRPVYVLDIMETLHQIGRQ